MNKSKIFSPLACLVMCGSCINVSAMPNLSQDAYLAVSGGIADMPTLRLGNIAGTSGAWVDVKTKTGYNVSAAVGKRFRQHWRGELQYLFVNNDVKSLTDSAATSYTGIRTSIKGHIGLVNGYYDFDLPNDKAQVYLAAGLGAARIKGAGSYTFLGITPNMLSDPKTTLAYQLGAGIGYFVKPQLELDAGYRYLGTQKATYKVRQWDGASLNTVQAKARYQNNLFSLGLRYYFDKS